MRSSRTMTIVRPEGPMFFGAPAEMRPYFETSMARDMMLDDMSATSGTLPVSGVQWNSTPPMVSLEQMCTYEACGSSFHSDCFGIAVNLLASPEAATFTVP